MDSLIESIDSQTVVLVAAIAIAFLGVRLLFRVLSVSLGSILTIVAIAVTLYYLFGISPGQLWFKISHLPQDLIRLVKGFV